MTDTSQETRPAHSAIKVLAALAELGEATAAAVAEVAGLGYSTTTPKLRAWEESGQAERFRTDDGRTLWRLTAAGRAATATSRESGGRTPADPVTPGPTVERETPDEQSRDGDDLSAVDLGDPGTSIDEHTERVGTDLEPATVETTTPTSTEADSAGEPPVGSTPGQETASFDTVDATRVEARPAKTRRAGGSLRGAILDILEAHPDRQYKTGELCKLIDAANAGSGAAKASPGAVVNAATKLVAAGTAMQTVERPATFQLAPASAGR
ncbi:MarR family transcriptional regulator [Micromonospora sp. ATA51]|uniref:MarR family transcriptional regulator n=1 Tax=Micromonospora sp. ATA51 TaxID=2806098 RepID=UPI001A3A7C23|nr:MarR family transcriptional regulator [Micromonospora sp. ATA51]MBM0226130.1 MarR family transcriptional regulator [Micromonospora sp. ATA51]